MEKDEFEKMCQKAGVKKEALCDTIFTRQFKKEVDKIISDRVDNIDIREDGYIPDGNKFSDYLKFCKLYPKGDYLQFKKFCQERKGD
ncbi:hypothetical protein ES703_20662 [subsurface metagenome]